MLASTIRRSTLLGIVTLLLSFASRPQGAEGPEALIVKCARPCAAVTGAVAAMGGQVTQTYDNIDALAVSVPASRVAELKVLAGPDAVRKDVIVARPTPIEPVAIDDPLASTPLDGAALDGFLGSLPANYNYNNQLIATDTLHTAGLTGQDVVVAVIDSGVQAAAAALGPLGTGTVIGGENLVPLASDPVASATSRLNDWHGTSVSSMIAAHANFVFLNTSRLVQSLRVHAPTSVIPCPAPFTASCPETASIVPMVGAAPAAKVYALKVFSSRGGGAPTSRVVAAMDRAITLRRNFDAGLSTAPVSGSGTENSPYVYNALNIQVVNMSLGGSTFYAGRDVEDELTEAMLDAGILATVSAGNSGFGAMTVESPGSGFGALTVAAASTAVHERVLRDQSALGRGVLFRPYSGTQTAYFSSRGPLPDGRVGPLLTANGFGSYTNSYAATSATGALVSCGSTLAVSGTCASRILFVSGTSFSAPTVAGAAALLRGAVPDASPEQVGQALVQGADPDVLADRSSAIDQGAGFLNVANALALLNAGSLDDDRDGRRHRERRHAREDRDDDDRADEVGAGGRSVIQNVRRAGLPIVQFRNDSYATDVWMLKPGQVMQLFIPADDRTERFTVSFTEVTPSGTPNTLFGDDLFVMGLDAPTSQAIHRIDPVNEGAFVNGDATFVIDNPQTGLVRLAIQGDWTNGGRISARVKITRQRARLARPTAVGMVQQDDLIPIRVNVPAGVSQAVFEVFWKQNWGRIPTNDIDVFVFRPDGTEVVDASGLPPAATASSPERLVVTNPEAGEWTVVVNGFTIWDTNRGPATGRDEYTLRVTADGRPIATR